MNKKYCDDIPKPSAGRPKHKRGVLYVSSHQEQLSQL